MTKRVSNVWANVCSMETINLAADKARKNKNKRKEVKWYLRNRDELNEKLRLSLINKEYKVSDYERFEKVTDCGKVREIHKLPFYPDRIIQHCVINTMQDRWIKSLTFDSYNCLPGRGITSKVLNHNMCHKLKRALLDRENTRYVYKCDIKKFYPSVDNDIFSECYRKDLKDKDLLWLLDEQNYSNEGLAIGNPDAQIGSHLVLRWLDHFIKEELYVKYYFRYADDMAIFSDNKAELHTWQWRIMNNLWYKFKLEIKHDRRIFPVTDGIDFGGYVFYPGYTRLRKRNKKAFVKKRHNPKSVTSYMGMLKHCDSRNLINKIYKENNTHMGSLQNLNIKIDRPFDGRKVKIDKVVGEKIDILDFRIVPSTKNENTLRLDMQVRFNNEKLFICGGYQFLITVLQKVPREELPLTDVVILQERGYYFEGTLNV